MSQPTTIFLNFVFCFDSTKTKNTLLQTDMFRFTVSTPMATPILTIQTSAQMKWTNGNSKECSGKIKSHILDSKKSPILICRLSIMFIVFVIPFVGTLLFYLRIICRIRQTYTELLGLAAQVLLYHPILPQHSNIFTELITLFRILYFILKRIIVGPQEAQYPQFLLQWTMTHHNLRSIFFRTIILLFYDSF